MKKITYLLFTFFTISISFAQPVSEYSFNESTAEYTAVVGTNSTAEGDDGTHDNIPIGFSFNFGGVNYSTFSISTNGFIRLGNGIGDNNWFNNFGNSAGQRPVIAPFWDDHNRAAGSITYNVSGTAPDRILEVGWDNISIGTGSNVSETATGSFKLVIHETTNVIEFFYNAIAIEELSASIGINDVSSYLSVMPGNPATTSSMSDPETTSAENLAGRKYSFTPLALCTNVPASLVTNASQTNICPNYPILLSLSGLPAESGFTYQWQSSENGSLFVDIEDAEQPTLATSQATSTYYRVIVSCGNQTVTSDAVQVQMTDTVICYCFPSYDEGKTDGDLISNVVIAGTTLSNNTGIEPVNPYYTHFTGEPYMTGTLVPGQSYEVSVSVGTYAWQSVAVWVDYNDDYVFSLEERVGFTATPILSNGTGTFSIVLACDAPAGVHRMRVRDVWDVPSNTIDPCENYGYGETEDYDITISSAGECLQPTALAVIQVSSTSAELTWNSGCNQNSWDVHVTLAGTAMPETGFTHPNVTAPLIVSGLEPMTEYDFYVRANCDENLNSDWAGPFSFSTLPMAVANDECNTAFALVPGGTFEQNAMVATNLGASESLSHPTPTCGTFAFGGDVWFSIVVPSDGNLILETQQDPGSELIDTVLAAYTGDCTSLTQIGCSDEDGIGGFSMLTLTGLTPGSTIYARVWEYANDNTGTFRISAYNALLSTGGFTSGSFSFAPNPVKDILGFTADEPINSIVVFNLLGQQVLSLTGSQIQSIDMSDLQKGAYLLEVRSATTSETIKIMKQ
jgi:hypothetical protein